MRTRPSSRFALPWRALVAASLVLSLALGHHAAAQTPTAELPEGPLGEQIQWIVDVANGDANVLAPGTIEGHFSPEFLEEVGLDELIANAYGLIRTYSPVTIVSVEETEPGVAGTATLATTDGTVVLLSVEVDPETGLITDFALHDASHADDHGHASASPAASPVASPAADDVLVTWDEIGEDFTSRTEDLLALGQEIMTAFLEGDYAAIQESAAAEVQGAITPETLTTVTESLTTNRVHMELPDLGVIMDGHVSGDTISGTFFQGSPGTIEMTAQTPQGGGAPTGTWDGTITEVGLQFTVTFSGDASSLGATMSVPSQNIADAPMRNVSFEAERPIGELIDEQAVPNRGITNLYHVLYAWGPGMLHVQLTADADGALTSFTMVPQWPLPADPAVASIELAPMFDGAWLTFWGGDTEFRNYHVVAPQQRHAYDLAVWNDGATFRTDGMAVEDYYAYGMTLYAPVAGEVVAVESSLPDLPPTVAQLADPKLAEEVAANPQPPAGNHIVIRTEDGLYVFLAHMQPDSAQVAVGDTVEAGDVLGLVGNSGNTSEPHIHVHVQTTADLMDPAAIGVPVTWAGLQVNGEPVEAAKPVQGDIIAPAE